MQRYILVLISLIIASCANAQKNFQGVIIYRLHANTEKKPDAELKIQFGDNKLKMRFKDKGEYDKEYMLVLFDSAAFYVVNEELRNFTKKNLVNIPSKQLHKRSFAGHTATPVSQENNGLTNLLNDLSTSATAVFYLADSLYYHIPPAFVNNKELAVVQEKKIILGAEISVKNNNYEIPDDAIRPASLITVEAIEIRSMIISEDEFRIPSGYILREDISYGDSVIVVTDSTVVSSGTEKKANKQPVKRDKPKSPQKSSAIKRKE